MSFWQFFRQGWDGRALLVRPSRIPCWISKILCVWGFYEFLKGKVSFNVQSGKITVWCTYVHPSFFNVIYITTLLLSNFSCRFLNPPQNFQFELHCSIFLDVRNLKEQVKKAFCYQKLFWPFTVWINCPSDLKNFANSQQFW